MNLNINTEFVDEISDVSLLVCAIGFEERSSFLVQSLLEKKVIDCSRVVCYYFLDNRNKVSDDNHQLLKSYGIEIIDIDKNAYHGIIDEIISRVKGLSNSSEPMNIHIDYSSMPRMWYANILIKLSDKLNVEDKIFFWYSHGDYTTDIKHCSTASADDFVIFSGKASIKPKERSHILGLGYDKIKSDAIRTVVDPSTLVVCYTYPQDNLEIGKTIQKEHKMILDTSALNFSLPIENFSFIVKRIKEVIIDLCEKGDVILIPDGPKPLILACSIIPEMMQKTGIVCFHVKSQNDSFIPENIRPTGKISGFSIKNK